MATVIFFCFLLSGLSSLIYEVLWMRTLILLFGSTTFAISTVLTAFKIFPYLLVFQSSEYDLLILGSFEPLPSDLRKLRARLSQPRVKEDLGRIQVKSVEDILAHFVFGTQEVPAFVKNDPINTDDNALLEFSAPRTLYIDTSGANFQALSKCSREATIYLRH